MKVIHIPYERTLPCTVHDVSQDTDCCLDEIKKLIGIEWAEIVVTIIKAPDPHRDYCLIVDEVGKLKEGWTSRINERASRFYAGSYHGDPIVGDVVLCAREWSPEYGECDLTGLCKVEEDVLLHQLL